MADEYEMQTDGAAPPDNTGSEIARTEPDVAPARMALVKVWLDRVRHAETYWEDQYKRMCRDMKFCRGYQWDGQTTDTDDRYVANIVQRHVAQKTAALYAKNPTAVARRRQTLDFAVWDGDPQSLMMAREIVAAAQMAGPTLMMDPQAMQTAQRAQALLADAEQGMRRRKMLDKLGKTLENVFAHQLGEQIPPFKTQMKQLVRRTITTGVGYVELGFHRLYNRRPEDVGRITDITEQIAALERLSADVADGEVAEYQAEAEELRQLLSALEGQAEMLVREGLDFDFPGATTIIPDTNCRQLKGFLGARWVARKFLLSPDDIKEIFKKDIGRQFTRYQIKSEAQGAEHVSAVDPEREVKPDDRACVYRVYDKSTGLVYHVCEGYPDFLNEPEPPACQLERFFPIFVLTFNDVEDENNIFPPSDVSLMYHMQVERNVARERLREHRDAARPKHVTSKGKLDRQDKDNLTNSAAHTVVELNGLAPGEKIDNVLQSVPHNPIDPNLYEVNTSMEDAMMVVGTQEANLGPTSGSTATESSIAEASRMSSVGSNVDDLDDFLTELARAASHTMLYELSAETVREIAGPGAVWPEWSKQEIVRDLWLEVRAGSSGKPNKAQEIQNFERLAPFLLQMPGVSPKWMFEQAVERLDDRLDATDAFIAGMPSITAMNSLSSPGTGDPATDPAQQGARGADNAPRPQTGDSNQGPNNAAVGAPRTNNGAPQTAAGSVRAMGGS